MAILSGRAGELRKLSFAVVETVTEALKSLLDLSNAKIDEEIDRCFKVNEQLRASASDERTLKAEVEKQSRAIQSYQKELQEKSKLFESCQAELKDRKEELVQTLSSLDSTERRLAVLNTELESKINEINDMKSACESLKKDLTAERVLNESVKDRFAANVEQLESKCAEIETQNERITRELNEARVHAANLSVDAERAIADEKKKLADLEASTRKALAAVASHSAFVITEVVESFVAAQNGILKVTLIASLLGPLGRVIKCSFDFFFVQKLEACEAKVEDQCKRWTMVTKSVIDARRSSRMKIKEIEVLNLELSEVRQE